MSEDEKDVVLLVPDDTEEDWGFADKDAKVISIPRDRWKEIVAFLDHPETGVRLPRPKKKEGNDCAD